MIYVSASQPGYRGIIRCHELVPGVLQNTLCTMMVFTPAHAGIHASSNISPTVFKDCALIFFISMGQNRANQLNMQLKLSY